MIKLLKRFAAYYRMYPSLFALDFSCAVAAGLLELAFPVAVKFFIDGLIPTGQIGIIALAAFGLLLVYATSAALHVVVVYWGHALGIGIETEMRRKAFDHLQKLSFGWFGNQKTGHLVARLTKDLEEIGEVAHHGPEDVFIGVMTLAGALALMLWVHVPLALITATILPVSAFITIRYGGHMTGTFWAIYNRIGEFNARIEENVGGIRVVQAFANEDHERKLFSTNNNNYRITKLRAYKVMATSSSLSYLSMRFVQVIVMLAGAWFVVRGDLTAGGFVGFLLLINVFFRPLDMINAVIEMYPKGIAGFRRYTEFIDTQPEIADRPHAKAVERLRGDVAYNDVSFGYKSDQSVLSNVDFRIHPGETIAFVGSSGAGKTTICSLLPRFYEISSGSITIDGIDIDVEFAAAEHRHRSAGRLSFRRHHPREYSLWPP